MAVSPAGEIGGNSKHLFALQAMFKVPPIIDATGIDSVLHIHDAIEDERAAAPAVERQFHPSGAFL